MSVEERIKSLTLQRDNAKNQVLEFQKFLSSYNKETDLYQLPIRLQRLSALFENFDTLCNDIDLLNDSADSIKERSIILNEFYHVVSLAQRYIAESCTNRSDPFNLSKSQNSDALSDVTRVTSTPKYRIKLPQASIPTFTGQLEQWLSFKNSFTSMIHNREDLSGVEKLHYLRTALRDEALKKVQVFPITDENYSKAWDVLEKAYENKRLLVSRHLSLLLHLPNQEKDGYRSVERLADEAQQHVQSLASLKVKLSPEIVVHILEEKLNKPTRMKWEESLTRDEFPSLDQIVEFLYKTAVSLSTLESDKYSSNRHDDKGPPNKMRKVEQKTARTLFTGNKKCPACSETEYHPLYKCKKFLDLSVNQRVKVVKEANLCNNCFKKHGKAECKFGKCKTCNKKHNTLLHFGQSNEKTKSENKDEAETKSE